MKTFEKDRVRKGALCILVGILLLTMGQAQAANDAYADHRAQSIGVELNILWPFAPFHTCEIKFRYKLGGDVEAVVGYGRQFWTYEGKRHNPGRMDSEALLLGTRAYLFGTGTSVEYTAWLAHDVFHHDNGQTYRGFSLDNEFYLGYSYYLPGTNVYLLPQADAAFWSCKTYSMPLNDLYTFDFLPKLSLGTDF